MANYDKLTTNNCPHTSNAIQTGNSTTGVIGPVTTALNNRWHASATTGSTEQCHLLFPHGVIFQRNIKWINYTNTLYKYSCMGWVICLQSLQNSFTSWAPNLWSWVQFPMLPCWIYLGITVPGTRYHHTRVPQYLDTISQQTLDVKKTFQKLFGRFVGFFYRSKNVLLTSGVCWEVPLEYHLSTSWVPLGSLMYHGTTSL